MRRVHVHGARSIAWKTLCPRERREHSVAQAFDPFGGAHPQVPVAVLEHCRDTRIGALARPVERCDTAAVEAHEPASAARDPDIGVAVSGHRQRGHAAEPAWYPGRRHAGAAPSRHPAVGTDPEFSAVTREQAVDLAIGQAFGDGRHRGSPKANEPGIECAQPDVAGSGLGHREYK
jgi:hypothetical protein